MNVRANLGRGLCSVSVAGRLAISMAMPSDTKNQHDVDGNCYVLTVGLPRIVKPFTLAPGVSLRPLDAELTVFDLAAAGAAGFRSWAALEPFAPVATCEIESAKDSDVTPGYDTLDRAWLASSLLVLCGFTRHTCVACSSYPWNIIAGHQERTSHVFTQQLAEEGAEAAVHRSRRELPRFKGDILDLHHKIIIDSAARSDDLFERDVEWIRGHFSAFNSMAAESDVFRFALEAAIDWRFSTDARAGIARLWAGVESVFGISSELVYRISLLAASLLESRGENRRIKFREVRNLYNLRSKAVHGDKLSDAKLTQALDGSYHLLRALLLLAIERGRPLGDEDFDAAVFG